MKYLNVGMPRTGTQSLWQAGNILGFYAVHSVGSVKALSYSNFLCEVYLPIKIIEENYPGSKYILTVRELHKWYESCRHHVRNRLEGWNPFWFTDPKTWVKQYKDRIKEVQSLISKERLLIYNICAGQGWEPLCEFLNLPVPDQPFPHRNKKRIIK